MSSENISEENANVSNEADTEAVLQSQETLEMAKVTINPLHSPFGELSTLNSSLFFNDGLRSVDYVIVWKEPSDEHEHNVEEVRLAKRKKFEQNLSLEGLELEEELIEGEIHFIKVSFYLK